MNNAFNMFQIDFFQFIKNPVYTFLQVKHWYDNKSIAMLL